jgi:hypothetical protein
MATLMLWTSCAKTFASPDALTLLELDAHDAVIAGDTLTTITLNSQWRMMLAGAINSYLANYATDDLTLENQQLLGVFFLDLYD